MTVSQRDIIAAIATFMEMDGIDRMGSQEEWLIVFINSFKKMRGKVEKVDMWLEDLNRPKVEKEKKTILE